MNRKLNAIEVEAELRRVGFKVIGVTSDLAWVRPKEGRGVSFNLNQLNTRKKIAKMAVKYKVCI